MRGGKRAAPANQFEVPVTRPDTNRISNPFSKIVTTDPTKSGFTKGALGTVIYALLIIVFLVFEPRGLAGIWRRIQAYFRSWPFSY